MINQIISNADNESHEFKASLQHLKNIKNKALQEDLEYYEGEEPDISHHPTRFRANSRSRPAGTFSDYLKAPADNEQNLVH